MILVVTLISLVCLAGCSDKKEISKIHCVYKGHSERWTGEIDLAGSIIVTKDNNGVNHYNTPYDMIIRLKYQGDPLEVKSPMQIRYSYKLGPIGGKMTAELEKAILFEYHGHQSLGLIKAAQTPIVTVTMGDVTEVIKLKKSQM